MAIRPEIPERVPIENVEVEYVGPRKPEKPGFNRVRLLGITPTEIELAVREFLQAGTKLSFTMHVKGIRDVLKADGEVKQCRRIIVMKQDAFSVLLQFGKLTPAQASKVKWAQDQLAPKQRAAPIRREEEKRAPAQPAAAAATGAAPAAVAAKPAEAPAATAAKPGTVKRPVALLQLIQVLDRFVVTDDLILSVIEAAEAGMDVEVLYPTKPEDADAVVEDEPSEASETSLPPEGGVARPLHVYRLANNAKLYFAESGLPQGPASELLYLSRLKSPESCFAVELGVDTMTHAGTPSFKRGSILVFSTVEKVEDGDFAFVRSRTTDEFAQVFFDKEEVRLRPLNPLCRERVARRNEIKALCKLVGHYQDNG